MDTRADRRRVGGTLQFFSWLTAELAWCMFCRARYLTPGKDGQTREERNEQFNQSDATPDWEIPEDGLYLFDWFEELTGAFNRYGEGRINRVGWRDYEAWISLTGTLIHSYEIAILIEMDKAYCEALEGELEYANAKAIEDAERARSEARKTR